MEQDYIPDFLPVVSKEVEEVYRRDLEKRSLEDNNDYTFHLEISEMIKTENPVIFECVKRRVEEFQWSPEFQSKIIDMAHEIYFLLNAQARVNYLESKLNPDALLEIKFDEDICLDALMKSYKQIGENWAFPFVNRII